MLSSRKWSEKVLKGSRGCSNVSKAHFSQFSATFERFLLHNLCKSILNNLKYSKKVLLVELHIVCKDHQHWAALFQSAIFYKIWEKNQFFAIVDIFYLLNSANVDQIPPNRNFAPVLLLEKASFFRSFPNFQVKITYWRWRQSKSLMQLFTFTV